MKDRVFRVLLVFVAFALSAFAQQNNSSSNPPLPSPSTSTPCNLPLTPGSNGDFWNGADPNVANLVGHPITSKKYVKGMTQPLADCLNQLDGTAAANTQAIKDIDGRSQNGVQLATARVNEADQHATDADNRARAAQEAAAQTTAHLSKVERVVGNLDQYKGGTQAEIDFRPGQTVLNKKAKNALDEMAGSLKDERNYVIEVRGYSSGQGHAAMAASRNMADSVVRYLVLNHQIPVHRIFAVGMGNVPTAAGATGKRPSSSRVEVSLLKNDLESSVQH